MSFVRSACRRCRATEELPKASNTTARLQRAVSESLSTTYSNPGPCHAWVWYW